MRNTSVCFQVVPKVTSKAENLTKCLDMYTAQLAVMSPPDKTTDDPPPNKIRVLDVTRSLIKDGFIS